MPGSDSIKKVNLFICGANDSGKKHLIFRFTNQRYLLRPVRGNELLTEYEHTSSNDKKEKTLFHFIYDNKASYTDFKNSCALITLDLSICNATADFDKCLEQIIQQLNSLKLNAPPNIPILLVGTKADIKIFSDPHIKKIKAILQQAIGSQQLDYIETSAMADENVTAAFEKTLTLIKERPLREQEKLKQEKIELDRKQALLNTVPAEIGKINKALRDKLSAELVDFKKRRKIDEFKSIQSLSEAEQDRYLVVQKLSYQIDRISDDFRRSLTIKTIDNWKKDYESKLVPAITNSLNDPLLDKYNKFFEKLRVKLLNLLFLVLFPLAIIKKLGSSNTYFFSTVGKTKEAVEEVEGMAIEVLKKPQKTKNSEPEDSEDSQKDSPHSMG